MRNIKLTSILITLTIISNLNLVSTKTYASTIDNDDWNLTWSDEFNEKTINTSNWTYDIDGHGWGNNELQYYTDRPENARVEDGNLIIEARKEAFKGSEYTSARLKSEGLQNFAYGKIEARIKLPKDQGIWPAFWMLGSNMASVQWPDCGEIDIMEHISNDENIWGTIHWKSDNIESCGSKMKVDVTDYHNYSIEWSPNYIKWFVDDNKYYEYDITNSVNGTTAFHKPFFIVLNMAVGGNWPKNPDSETQFPAKMYVDYVRVYNHTDKNALDSKTKNAWFQDKTNGKWYYLNGNGIPFKGWLYTKDYWYYLDENGEMKTGWIYNNGTWYYLDDNGIMLKDTTINGFKLGPSGSWIK